MYCYNDQVVIILGMKSSNLCTYIIIFKIVQCFKIIASLVINTENELFKTFGEEVITLTKSRGSGSF